MPGLATVPTTILLYYVLGLAVDAAFAGSNLLRQWFWLLVALVLAKAGTLLGISHRSVPCLQRGQAERAGPASIPPGRASLAPA